MSRQQDPAMTSAASSDPLESKQRKQHARNRPLCVCVDTCTLTPFEACFTLPACTVVLGQLSTEMGAGLTKQQISAAMGLMRLGVNPGALAAITQELRREARQNPPSAASTTARAAGSSAQHYPQADSAAMYR
ncbi:hypothetical protein GQ54DRAFT_286092 [Martensiomyces pterosporus]|nr:hypothetical protein GQ54DRAFT_286092 [Martensiomyces pterosporus]